MLHATHLSNSASEEVSGICRMRCVKRVKTAANKTCSSPCSVTGSQYAPFAVACSSSHSSEQFILLVRRHEEIFWCCLICCYSRTLRRELLGFLAISRYSSSKNESRRPMVFIHLLNRSHTTRLDSQENPKCDSRCSWRLDMLSE